MQINIEITDQQAANLAAANRVSEFTDGNDLISQVIANSDLMASKRAIISMVAQATDQGVLDAMAASPGVSIKLPPIKIAKTL